MKHFQPLLSPSSSLTQQVESETAYGEALMTHDPVGQRCSLGLVLIDEVFGLVLEMLFGDTTPFQRRTDHALPPRVPPWRVRITNLAFCSGVRVIRSPVMRSSDMMNLTSWYFMHSVNMK